MRYITDNLYLPFGGFYPENWLVERKPWLRSLGSLRTRHEKTLAVVREQLEPWTAEPVDDLNQQQFELERLNTELGFLFPHFQREEFGKNDVRRPVSRLARSLDARLFWPADALPVAARRTSPPGCYSNGWRHLGRTYA